MALKPEIFAKTPRYFKDVGHTVVAYFPLAFLAWDYYNTGDLLESCVTIARDFLWPAAVAAASFMNASPYQMLATNIGGISWTIYNCFFCEHDDLE